jgi:RNA 3'-terminal phosphate cyclase (ATP)
MIELDGSLGEGGGQILRSALALSLITQQAFTISNIRAKRPKPGLMRQHLACVQAAAAVCGLDVSVVAGAALGSTSLTFLPRPVLGGDYAFNVGSAGSCMLVLQTVLWPLLLAYAPSTLTLQGGTHNPMAPSATYLQQTLPQVLAQTGGLVAIEVQRYGFYPAGGGVVAVQITPPAVGVDVRSQAGASPKLMPLRFTERGALKAAYAVCLHAGVPQSVAQRELETIGKLLNWNEAQLNNRALRQNEGPGNALQAVLQYEHITEVFTAFGERGKSAEQVGREVAALVDEYHTSGAPVGEYLSDQLMLPLALAGLSNGSGEYVATQISEHARTNAAVIEAFLPVRFVFEELAGGAGVRVSLVQAN